MAGFQISRNIEELHNIFNEFVQENGEVAKTKNNSGPKGGD